MSSLNNISAIKSLYHYGDNFYVIIREIPIHNFSRKNGTLVSEYFNEWKKHLSADHVFKTQTHFVFCKTVKTAEIISETVE